MGPISLDAAVVKEAVGTSTDASTAVELTPIDVSGVTYAPAGTATLEASLTNTGEGLLLHGTITAPYEVSCSRCLAPFAFTVATDVDTLFIEEGSPAERDEDQDILEFAGDQIDIAPVIESAIRVEMPLAPVCDDECAGICPECGTDLNASACTCADQPALDGPFAGLKDLLETDDAPE
jgi:uncharacterized protein